MDWPVRGEACLEGGQESGSTLLTAGNHLGLSCNPEGHLVGGAAELSQPEAEDIPRPQPPKGLTPFLQTACKETSQNKDSQT